MTMQLRSRALFVEYLRVFGLSERAFAAQAGLSHSTVNHLLTGRRSTCSAETAIAIERALGCRAGTLFAPGEPPRHATLRPAVLDRQPARVARAGTTGVET